MAELRGLKKEMVVYISNLNDAKTFDKNKNKDVTKTALWLKEYPSNTQVYKPVLLNKTNAQFFIGLTGSEYIEDWENKPVVLFAMPDTRHGHVVRFKEFIPPAAVDPARALGLINAATDLATLGTQWAKLTPKEKNIPVVLARKEELKTEFKTPPPVTGENEEAGE